MPMIVACVLKVEDLRKLFLKLI